MMPNPWKTPVVYSILFFHKRKFERSDGCPIFDPMFTSQMHMNQRFLQIDEWQRARSDYDKTASPKKINLKQRIESIRFYQGLSPQRYDNIPFQYRHPAVDKGGTPLPRCFFVSDLHGNYDRYQKLLDCILREQPEIVFIGGDLLPSGLRSVSDLQTGHPDFIRDYLSLALDSLRTTMGDQYPEIFVIMGNDDCRGEEPAITEMSSQGLWKYCHQQRYECGRFHIYGYSYIPPTPFRLKDWERYDVSQYVDPGCSAPNTGIRTFPVPEDEIQYSTIKDDLKKLAGKDDVSQGIFLFHAPPYRSNLDRAALDDKWINMVPLDVHIGSIAIANFISLSQPLVTLHGHVHESTRLTGFWHQKFGRTHSFNAAHDGPELVLIRFDPENLDEATHHLI